MQNILIMVKQEGASGVWYIGQRNTEFSSQALAGDVNAAAAAIRAAGYGVKLSDLNRNPYISMTGRYLDLIDKDIEVIPAGQVHLHLSDIVGVVLLGMTAGHNTANAFAPGLYNYTAWRKYCINGKDMGEIGLHKTYFSFFDIPVLAVSGDRAACEEAQKEIPSVKTVAVKTAKFSNVATCLPEETAREAIKTAVMQGVGGLPVKAAKRPALPIKIDIQFTRTDFCDDCMFHNTCKLERLEPRTLRKELQKVDAITQFLY